MKLHATLERLRSFGGLGPVDLDPSDDGWEVVDDYHGYAGTDPERHDDEHGDQRAAHGGLRLLTRRRHAEGDQDTDTDTDTDAGVRGRAARSPGDRIDPRIAARRRDVVLERDVKRQKRWLAVAVITTVLALAFGITRSGLLDLDTVVAADGAHTTAAEVRAASGLEAGDPLVGLDLDAALTRIRALPWVATVDGEKDWDGTVRFRFTERTPAAVLAVGDGAALLVDAERRVLARTTTPPADLVTVTGVVAAEPGATLDPATQPAIDLARSLTPGVRTRVTEVRVLPDGHLELGLRPAGRAVLGAGTDLDRKLLAVRTVLGQVDLAQLCVLDVRVPDAPVLTRASPCA